MERGLFYDRAACALFATVALSAFLLRIILYPAGSPDDAEWLVATQIWSWSYDYLHPPLVTWLGKLWQMIFGIGLTQLLALKFLLLFGFYATLYGAGRTLFGPSPAALAIAVAPMGTVFIAWEPLLSYVHSMLLLFACGLSFLVWVRLARNPSWSWYVALGLAFAIGLLAKYTFAAFAGSMLAAALWTQTMRHLIVTPKLIATALIVAVLVTPHLMAQTDAIAAILSSDEVGHAFRNGGGFWMNRIAGTGSLLEAFFSFALPLAALIPIWFFGEFRRPVTATPSTLVAILRPFFWRWFAVMAIGLWGAILVLGVTYTRTHHLYFASLFFVPLIVEAVLRGATRRKLISFVYFMFGMQVLALTALTVHGIMNVQDCKKCHMHMPYDVYAASLKDIGFQDGTIITYSGGFVDIGENLRSHFPEARILSLQWPETHPPPREGNQTCLILWDDDSAKYIGKNWLRKRPPPEMKGPIPDETVIGRLTATYPGTERSATTIGYALVPSEYDWCG